MPKPINTKPSKTTPTKTPAEDIDARRRAEERADRQALREAFAKKASTPIQILPPGAAGLAYAMHTHAHSIRRDIGITVDACGVYAWENRNYDGREEMYREISAHLAAECGCSEADRAMYPDDPDTGNTLAIVWYAPHPDEALGVLREALYARGKSIAMGLD